jgi:hypothetical protein
MKKKQKARRERRARIPMTMPAMAPLETFFLEGGSTIESEAVPFAGVEVMRAVLK